jgi:hypothetical protein
LAKIAENCDHNIDPRLGESPPMGDYLQTLGSFVAITEKNTNNCATFFHGNIYVLILKRMV